MGAKNLGNDGSTRHLARSSKGGRKSATIQCRRSKDEIALFNLCEQYYTRVTHNEIIVEGWDADIILSDHRVAILWNGPWHYKEMGLSNHSLKQVQTRDYHKTKALTTAGWQVIVYRDDEYTPTTAFEELKKIIT